MDLPTCEKSKRKAFFKSHEKILLLREAVASPVLLALQAVQDLRCHKQHNKKNSIHINTSYKKLHLSLDFT
jgi:hypothetical protein